VTLEPLARLVADGLEDLGAAHWQESEHDKSVFYALDLIGASSLERAGGFRIFAFREGGRLVGYASFIFGSLHAAAVQQAFLDAVYLDPGYRGHGAYCWRKVENVLRNLGVHRLVCSVPDNPLRPGGKRGTVGQLFQALGYRRFEVAYSKILGAENVERKKGERRIPADRSGRG